MIGMSTVEQYIIQWLKTATQGNVRVTFAWLTDRMHLHCDVCQIGLTAPRPATPETVDYSVQEYVKIHAHVGGHKDEVKSPEGKPIPLTCDFKVVPGKIFDYEPMQLGPSKIDQSELKAAQIQKQMAKYESELKGKIDAQAIANKIKVLQLQEQAKQAQAAMFPEKAYDEEYVAKQKQELTQLQAIEIQSKIDALKANLNKVVGHTSPPVRKDKPLKQATGRKFR